jgi:hypothetical protein
MSCIVEFQMTMDEVPSVLDAAQRVAKEIDSVMAIGIYTRCDAEGNTELEKILADNQYSFLRAKTNVGLGRAEQAPAPEAQMASVGY